MRRMRYGLVLLLLLAACAPRRPAMAEKPTHGEPQPEVGIVRWVDPRQISILLPGATEPRKYARTQDSRVFEEGIETAWAELEAGLAVRVHSVEGPFSPLHVIWIEILSGEVEEAVRKEILASPEGFGGARLRNLHLWVGRGS